MMRTRRTVLILGALLMAGCGVGPQAGQLARQEGALLAAVPADDAGVRQVLVSQSDAWNALAVMLTKKQLGGVPVGEDFRALVAEVAQLAGRQRALIETGADDPATNQVVLGRLRTMWSDVGTYLGQ